MSTVGSLAVHCALALGLRGISPVFAGQRPLFPMQLELRYSAPLIAQEPLTSPVGDVVPVQAAPEQGRTPSRARAAARIASVLDQAPSPVIDTPADVESQSAATFDLSPRAAARAAIQVGLFAVHTEDDAGPISEGKTARELASRILALNETSSGNPLQAADRFLEQAVRRALRPWKALQSGRSGCLYYYVGNGFDAAIMPDGEVRYLDKHGAHLTLMQLIARDGSPGKAAPGLNLNDSVSKLARGGADQFAGERRTFLEKTRELRDFLRDRAERNYSPLGEPQ